MRKALIIGASGQIGVELTLKLEQLLGKENVLASDIRPNSSEYLQNSNYVILDVLDKEALIKLVIKEQITEVYHLAATLSANAERNPEFSWNLNMQSLFNVLDLAKNKYIKKVFWPSSIAVFGPGSEKHNTPQETIMDPNTVYGISKLAGERWCQYYFEKFGVDVRSVRFPGLLGYKAEPGGGTTDYALWAIKNAAGAESYTSFLDKNTRLPMMHMEDAIASICKIMDAPYDSITIRSSYNISGCDFTPAELESKLKIIESEFHMNYDPDFRQSIADSWPGSLSDEKANKDWGWTASYDFQSLIESIYEGFKKKVPSVTFS